jgi:O-antigen ligase
MDSFYTITNPDAAVGFFANRDHLAALLYALLPFAAALGGEGLRARRAESRGAVVCAAAFGLVFFLGVAATGSLSGLALCVVALIGCGPLLLRGRAGAGRVRAWAPALLLVGAIVALLFLQFSRIGVLDRLQVQASNVDEGRFAITSTTLGAAAAYFPLGSGLGTFVPIYAAAEPVATLSTEYWNHAHNDWAEIWLEGGLPIAAVIVGFLVWSGRAALRAWKSTTGAGAGEFALPWAGFIAIGLLLIHSTADYPLRTCAIMAVFGFACAMLVIPPPAADA